MKKQLLMATILSSTLLTPQFVMANDSDSEDNHLRTSQASSTQHEPKEQSTETKPASVSEVKRADAGAVRLAGQVEELQNLVASLTSQLEASTGKMADLEAQSKAASEQQASAVAILTEKVAEMQAEQDAKKPGSLAARYERTTLDTLFPIGSETDAAARALAIANFKTVMPLNITDLTALQLHKELGVNTFHNFIEFLAATYTNPGYVQSSIPTGPQIETMLRKAKSEPKWYITKSKNNYPSPEMREGNIATAFGYNLSTESNYSVLDTLATIFETKYSRGFSSNAQFFKTATK